jgi:hypothetical protein
MKKIGWYVLVALAVLTLALKARAEYAPVVQPRILHGVFCNTPEQMKAVLDNVKLGAQSIAMVNTNEVVCVLHDTSAVLVSEMRFIRSDKFDDGLKLWLYAAKVEGYVFGGNPRKVEPSTTQYVYMMAPVDPSHVDEEA